MFERTFSFWRRLVGKPERTTEKCSSTAVEDDRRLWVRYAAEFQGKLQVAGKQGEHAPESGVAEFRDVSVGGASLIVDKPLRAGQMVRLELPGDGNQVQKVLACVVRSRQEADGRWSVGCVFSRELSQADLSGFGAEKVESEQDDKRNWVRYTCKQKAFFRPFGAPANESRPAHVLNISATGIGLLINPGLDAGRLLNVDLLDKTGRKVCAILACVVHTTEREDGDHAIGCNFIRELSEEELESLL